MARESKTKKGSAVPAEAAPRKRINSRRKGKVGEREFANWLKNSFGDHTAKRGVQFKGGQDSPDVESLLLVLLGIHPEVKRTIECCLGRPTRIIEWLEQAERDAAGAKQGVVFYRWDRHTQWQAIYYTNREKQWYKSVDARVFLEQRMAEKGVHAGNMGEEVAP